MSKKLFFVLFVFQHFFSSLTSSESNSANSVIKVGDTDREISRILLTANLFDQKDMDLLQSCLFDNDTDISNLKSLKSNTRSYDRLEHIQVVMNELRSFVEENMKLDVVENRELTKYLLKSLSELLPSSSLLHDESNQKIIYKSCSNE